MELTAKISGYYRVNGKIIFVKENQTFADALQGVTSK